MPENVPLPTSPQPRKTLFTTIVVMVMTVFLGGIWMLMRKAPEPVPPISMGKEQVMVIEKGLLEGMPDDLALSATKDYWSGDMVEQSDIQDVPGTPGIVRVNLIVRFSDTATIASVNHMLEKYDARIVNMREGSNQLTIRFLDPGSLEALESLRARMAEEEGIESVEIAHPV